MIPKFRAWDPHEKKMIDDKELVIWGGNIYRGERDKIFQKIIKGKKGLIGYSFDDKYLMELAYDDDNTIYDKDIIMDCASGEVGVVLYDTEDCAWKVKTDFTEEWLGDWTYCDVIGNIYENPELLGIVEE
ncbi:YopX family protein [Streptococcus equi subsp. zooepidemicus]|uniref:Phage protein n=1 Tax=Streptococcus equi subsp. zooepidemicus TaxID=40041 RepID=A0AAJ1PJN9_STRSZ|nr:YopX family protein [Streptococcus equi]MCD3390868.1 YopX family protein [Streptococcus equi subsp. zooepidemicus]MCD3417784.1 YopX family protein [Streptococcus equi subsp. zooepidemicus]MCD3422895.1 YopX family protein [Streptococcus equi subsp. zooepidemicus]MCD3433961.1 YopX family protein [Streptococcus equi subsp. zooepidemicus]MCD3435599.1 YopX family protein [Streptococcus equi subsp. zooepidemicus]